MLPRFDGVCLLDGINDRAQREFRQAATKNGIDLFIIPVLSEMIYSKFSLVNFDDVLSFHMLPYRFSTLQSLVKRIMDIVFAALLLILALVPMLLVALAIKLTSPGPIFYTQERVTYRKKIFRIFKFRTMVMDAEKYTGPILATKNDPRITPIGAFLRKCRLDELPQLLNVLLGHMSMVGPRPERPFFVEQYLEEVENYEYRLAVKAGLTSLSHVYGRYSTDVNDRLRYDLLYINDYSWLLDIKILLQTSRIMFTPSASEGVQIQVSSNSVHMEPTTIRGNAIAMTSPKSDMRKTV